MEGAAVVHAANRVSASGIEIRSISNRTGDRDKQEWDIELALNTLGQVVNSAITALWK